MKNHLPKDADIPAREQIDDFVYQEMILSSEIAVKHSCYNAFILSPFYN